VRAAERAFRLITRILVRAGLGAGPAIEIVKRAHLEATGDVLKERGLPVTPARLSITSGLNKTEVLRIQEAVSSAADVDPSSFDQLARMMSVWRLDPRYTVAFTDDPRDLSIEDSKGGVSFNALARQCAPGLDPDELLEELLRVGAVTVSEETGRVHLVARAYVAEPHSPNNIERLGRHLFNYSQTLEANFNKSGPGRGLFERHATADFAVSPEAEAKFNSWIRVEGQKLLEAADAFFAEQTPVPENGRRVGIVLFHYVETDVKHSEPEPAEHGIDPETRGDKVEVIDTLMGHAGAQRNDGDPDSNVIDTLQFDRGKSR
jgi:hypothetical protein